MVEQLSPASCSPSQPPAIGLLDRRKNGLLGLVPGGRRYHALNKGLGIVYKDAARSARRVPFDAAPAWIGRRSRNASCPHRRRVCKSGVTINAGEPNGVVWYRFGEGTLGGELVSAQWF